MAKWLDRALVTGPYLALVLDEKGYHKAMKGFKVPRNKRPSWLNSGADATCHILESPARGLGCVVALRVDGHTGIQIAALLVHEAVHVFQQWCSQFGESSPSAEFQAYSIQAISQRLMESYADQTKGKG